MDHTDKPSKTVLVVDDNADSRQLIKLFLNNFGYVVDLAAGAVEALACFDPARHDVILTDNSMPGMSGGEMVLILKKRSPSTPVVMCTGNPPSDCASIDILINKPTDLFSIKSAVDKCLGLP